MADHAELAQALLVQRKRLPQTPEEAYQTYMGEVITKNTQRDVRAESQSDSYRRPNLLAPRFSQAAEDMRQLQQLQRANLTTRQRGL